MKFYKVLSDLSKIFPTLFSVNSVLGNLTTDFDSYIKGKKIVKNSEHHRYVFTKSFIDSTHLY